MSKLLAFAALFVFMFCINYCVIGQNTKGKQQKESTYAKETKNNVTIKEKTVEQKAVVNKSINSLPALPSKIQLESKNLEELQMFAIVRFNKRCLNEGIYLTEQQSMNKQTEVDQLSKQKLIIEILKDGREITK